MLILDHWPVIARHSPDSPTVMTIYLFIYPGCMLLLVNCLYLLMQAGRDLRFISLSMTGCFCLNGLVLLVTTFPWFAGVRSNTA